ncbi:hypothetical protein [Kosakonia cowanii]|uniref:hypothetical protein n=1 Tax=Kosakonia cowanii TaxID=208223 RepID=UPI0028B214D6|nr:hypothetical protein [Kosakonia cowanii]
MRKKENKAKKEKFRQFFPENYDIGISLNEENQLRLFSKRNDSQGESLCKYEFSKKIKVQYIFCRILLKFKL